MFQLLLNGLPAVVKSGTTFTFTRENPIYSEQEDYTFDVQLPLSDCPENQRIFGALHHLQQPVSPTATADDEGNSYHLIAPPLDISGSYIITSITDEDIKIQLTAGRTSIRSTSSDILRSEDIYVDELNLGFAIKERRNGKYVETQEDLIRLLVCAGNTTWRDIYLHGTSSTDARTAVCFPVYSEADDAWSNAIVRHAYFTDDGSFEDEEINLPLCANLGDQTSKAHAATGEARQWYYPSTLVVAPQPFLYVVIERVLTALGFPFNINTADEDDCLRSDWRSRIFIANARGTNLIAGMLPHWTVKEFIRQCEDFLGITITTRPCTEYDEDMQKAYGVKYGQWGVVRNRFYATTGSSISELVTIAQATDDHSSEYDSESTTGSITTGNVAYTDEYSTAEPYVYLNDDILSVCTIQDYDSDDAFPTIDASADDFPTLRSYIYHATDTDRYYVIGRTYYEEGNDDATTYYYIEVDHLGPLLRRTDSREADTTLKIIPCRQTTYDLPVYAYQYNGFSKDGYLRDYCLITTDKGYLYGGTQNPVGCTSGTLYALATADTRVVSGYEPVAAADILSGEADIPDTNKRDFIEVAYAEQGALNFRPTITGHIQGLAPLGKEYMQMTPIENGETNLSTSKIDIQPSGTELYPYINNRDGEEDLYYTLRRGGRPLFSLRTAAAEGSKYGKSISLFQTPSYTIDTRLQRTINFTDNITPDPTSIFLIRGRRYVCLKLEYTISPDSGLSPLKKGTFVEIGET